MFESGRRQMFAEMLDIATVLVWGCLLFTYLFSSFLAVSAACFRWQAVRLSRFN